MTLAKIDKLYSKLTPHEQAALALESLARQDNAETDRIVGSVTQLTYRCPHFDFRRRLSGLINLSLYYALIYWKTRTYMAVAHYHSKTNHDPKDQAAAFEYMDRLQAMETALAQVCDTLNIDLTAVKKIALCEDEAVIGGEGDPALVDEYTGLFMGLVK
jgi:hypothetical protein